MRFELKTVGEFFRVWDTKDKVWITKDVPSKKIAQEIADDFEKLSNGDFSPLFDIEVN